MAEEKKKVEETKTMADVQKAMKKKYDNLSFEKAEKSLFANIEAIPTGCFSLDRIFGCGGMPVGRIIEMAGMESSGKTTLALFLIAQLQKAGHKAMFIDAEHSFSNKYAQAIGVNTKELYLITPDIGEEIFDVMQNTIDTGEVKLIVVDSVASILPGREEKSEIDKDNVAAQARLITKGLQRITGRAARNKTTILFINQVRQGIGGYMPTETTPGGKALKFYASVRFRISGKKIEEDKSTIGNTMTIFAKKNKVANPHKTATLDVYFSKGVDIYGDILDCAEIEGIVVRAGATYSFVSGCCEERLGVGRDKARKFLEDNKEICEIIRKQLEDIYKVT